MKTLRDIILESALSESSIDPTKPSNDWVGKFADVQYKNGVFKQQILAIDVENKLFQPHDRSKIMIPTNQVIRITDNKAELKGKGTLPSKKAFAEKLAKIQEQ